MDVKNSNTIKQSTYKTRVLHLLHHSLPHISGYTIRSHYILTFQKKFAIPFALTPPISIRKKNPDFIDNVCYFRFPPKNGIEKLYDLKLIQRLKVQRYLARVNSSVFKAKLKHISKVVKEQKIDLIHGHTPFTFSQWGEKVARKNNLPFIYEVRGFWEDTFVALGYITKNGYEYLKMRYNETKLMKKADAVVTLGKMMKNELISRKIDRNKIFIVPNAVDTKNFQKKSIDLNLKQKLGMDGKYIIGYVGLIRKIEGIELLIKALRTIRNKIKNVELLIVGRYNKDYLMILKKFAKQLDVEKSVQFIGQVQKNEVQMYYSIIDIVVIPRINTRVTRIVTPLKTLEAMAMGKVLLTSDLPALREMVKPGISGDVFKSSDSNELANKIIYYLSDQKARISLENRAKNFVKKKYDWLNIVEKYNSIYKNLLG